MKKHITLIVISFILSTGLLLVGLLAFSDDEILIQSLESRTNEDKPVFNKIKYIKSANKDIWMMNQSHSGLTQDKSKWERLAIVVENKSAKFYQFEAGPLEWSEDLLKQQVAFRVSCFQCHNNGPRSVRPAYAAFDISFSDKAKIFFWNIKIKTYGRIEANVEMDNADKTREVPFRHIQPFENQELKVATCVKCHNDDGLFARGFLKRQQAGTIDFLVKKKLMPPPGFSLSTKELSQLKDFVLGF